VNNGSTYALLQHEVVVLLEFSCTTSTFNAFYFLLSPITMSESWANEDQALSKGTGKVEVNDFNATGDDINSSAPAADGSMAKKEKKASSKTHRDDGGIGSSDGKSDAKLTPNTVESLLPMNPSLRGELAGMDQAEAADTIRKMNIADLLTGLSLGGKNQKDMASHKFWQTQPVPRFDDRGDKEGPIKIIDPNSVSKQPDPLLEGFEWVTLDLVDENELKELYELLSCHYVEDENAMFRFNYSKSFLNWYAQYFFVVG
jgi:Myristoyl-CoA:protein N-myristoyltransferase, N-terminal domain